MKDIGESFRFVFRDPNWFLKLFLGGVFSLLSIILIGIPVIYGYRIELLRRVRRREEYPLPEWKDVGIMFITGFKYIVTQIVYFLPLLIFFIPMIGIMIYLMAQGAAPDELIGATPVLTLFMLGVAVYSIFILLITPVIAIRYSKNERIADGLNIGIIVRLFKNSWQDIVIVVILGVALDILATVGIIAFIIGIFFTSFYAKLVQFHLYGQIAISLSLTEPTV
jgi:hypothetical protein